MNSKNIKIGFFGTPEYAVMTLQTLTAAGFTISFVVTMPDRPQGRNLTLTPTPVKIWAEKNQIPVLQPEKLRDPSFIESLKKYECDVFVVMAYGKIMPEEILNIPKGKSLNLHPSLLPKYRGPCPMEGAILADDRNTGVTIMLMDKEMDHGPIVAATKINVQSWPPQSEILGKKLVQAGADLLVSILPDWVSGKIKATEQNHAEATYTQMIKKEDGEINLEADPYQNFLKIQAYHGWPSAFFFAEKDGKRIRVKITQASFNTGKLTIEKVIPEGKKEISYEDWVKSVV